MKKFALLLTAALALSLSACKDEKEPLAVPAQYDGTNFTANTTTEYALRNQMRSFVAELQKGRTPGTILTYDNLLLFYTQGSPSLKSITTGYFDGRLAGANNWLDELAKSSGTGYTPGVTAGQGGTFGGYLFDENGLELEQLADKGLFGAAFYHYAYNLMQDGVTLEEADQLVAIFGAHPDFPNTPTAAKAANPDVLMANYAARRDKNDGQGLYAQIKTAFIRLQAALKAGEDYNEERDQALADIRTLWEKINFATVVNYCHSVISIMSATSTSEADKGRALHAYGECVGFVHGWRNLPAAAKQMSDAEIDELLVLLNAPQTGTPTSYKFITEPVSELPKLNQIIQKIQTKYGFSNQEIEDFKNNWVTVQGR